MPDCRILLTDWAHEQTRLSRIRRTVFIDEQGVPEAMEWDADDAGAVHLLAVNGQGEAIGCARLLPDGHVGRMAVLPAWRGQGVGRALLAAVPPFGTRKAICPVIRLYRVGVHTVQGL